MRNQVRVSKLIELRAKTDRELAVLVRNKLKLGLKLAGSASGPGAEAAYAEAALLLPWISGPSKSDLQRLQTMLEKLRRVLGAASGQRVMRAGSVMQ